MNSGAWLLLLLCAVAAAASHGGRRRHCQPDLREAVKRARAVVTGKVTALYVGGQEQVAFEVTANGEDAWGGAEKRLAIRVKRVLKGPVLEPLLDVEVPPPSAVAAEADDCRHVLRIFHTAIFLLDEKQRLTAPPVPVTLNNLDKVEAFAKDKVYKPSPPIREEPCETKFCPLGEVCREAGGRATCVCPVECPPGDEPVCGSDGLTYDSPCHLHRHSCSSRDGTRIEHHGPCHAADPCREVRCRHGARCVPAPDGLSASCECPRRCPLYGDHAASRPVCGSDAKDYRDTCELRRAACDADADITVKFHGKCDPCEGVACPPPEVCQLDADRRPVCQCGEACSLEFTPVCGSDGKTYSNECSLRQEACRARKTLRIIYRGKCSSGGNPCAGMVCGPGQECAITRYGIAQCECAARCEAVMRPVCGDDGSTYESACELQRAACAQKRDIQVAHAGACGGRGPCATQRCELGAVCVERGGEGRCECPQCPAEFDPVCGSDGVSYGNACKLLLQACTHRRNITVLYKGLCSGCEGIKCPHYSTCESDSGGAARCVCPENCPDENSPVCGSDGATYGNECQLRRASCKDKRPLRMLHQGVCDQCQGVECEWGARCEGGQCVCPTNCSGGGRLEPVCASNMETFPSECHMRMAACHQPLGAPPLAVIFYGDCQERLAALTTTRPSTRRPAAPVLPSPACQDIQCDFHATCELGPDLFPRCSCIFDCANAPQKPVCASDMRSYPSVCAMRQEGCQRQQELRLRPMDLCQGMEVKPCKGAPPLVDPTTGAEFDCGSGPSRQDCPAHSYCHQTPHFARCCRKDTSGTLKSCEDSWFGCCPDGKTPALGPDNAGCPSLCNCNKLGSYSDTCDPATGQCTCKPGVGGEKCDRCEPGFWGLPKISEGHQGCIPCGCSPLGSVRDDCEQMTGRCVCKPGVQGQKCTVCGGPNKVLGPNGCTTVEVTTAVPSSCSELRCLFGASCEEHAGRAQCVCSSTCMEDSAHMHVVCGSDGQTYGSECQLKLFSCRYQKDIAVQAFGPCKEDPLTGTEGPLRKSTALRSTEPEDVSSPLYKSTRHLLLPESPGHRYSLTSASLHHLVSNKNDYFYETGYRPTPATVHVVQALVGDLCSVSEDCGVRFTRCDAGACVCKEGFKQSPDRQHCIEHALANCEDEPCLQGGTCINQVDGGFLCECPPGWGGPLCNIAVVKRVYDIPAFDGRSYVRLKRLKAYNKLSVEVEFKTYANDGIILYNQQKADGTGDFVSLAIVNGYLEFRYNLGNGPVIISSLERVQMKRFHKVVVKRYHRDGMLKLDDGDDVAGQSQGMLKALDLLEDAFIGYVPTNVSRVFENVGTSLGLVGCIRKLKVGRHEVELHQGLDALVEEVVGVRECGENPCSHLPCRHGGTCHAVDSEHFRCTCTRHFSGEFCETRIDACLSNPCAFGSTCEDMPQGGFMCKCPPGRKGKICQDLDAEMREAVVPEFDGRSYMELPRLEGVSRAFSLEIWFLMRSMDGLLLYNGQLPGGKGDFISISLVRGYVQFRFDLGSGAANITSEEPLSLGEWHAVKASRVNQEGSLQVDDGTPIKGSSGPPLNELNLELPLYIGGLPNGVEAGLDGAVQRVMLNGQVLEAMADLSRLETVGRYLGPPCPADNNPCLNGGVCQPLLANYGCKCPLRYAGMHCQDYNDNFEMERPIRFTGETFYQYPNKVEKSTNYSLMINGTNSTLIMDEDDDFDGNEDETNDELEGEGDMYDEEDFEFFDKGRRSERSNRYEIVFRTMEPNGLILWLGRGRSAKSEYLALAVVNGHLELSVHLGRQRTPLTLRSKVVVSDGAWHTVLAQRRQRRLLLQVDDRPPIRGLAEPGAYLLNSNGRLWIGGSPMLPSGLPAPYYLGFTGCIDEVRVSKRPLDMLRRDAGDMTTIQFCHENDIR